MAILMENLNFENTLDRVFSRIVFMKLKSIIDERVQISNIHFFYNWITFYIVQLIVGETQLYT